MQPLETLLDDWKQWPVDRKPQLIKQFTEGLNHQTALLQAGDQQWVLKRLSTADSPEIANQQWAASQQLAPDVVFVAADASYFLMPALPGPHLLPKKIDDSTIQSLAQALRNLHAADDAPRRGDEFEIRAFCDQYLQHADGYARQLDRQLAPALTLFIDDPTPKAFCHNDLVAANCFIDHQQAKFIDWEYANWHNPWFDLAAIIYYLRLSDPQTRTLLTCYQANWQVAQRQPIYWAAQIALLWGDMLWHLDKFGKAYWSNLQPKLADLKRLAAKMQITLV